MGQYRKKPVVIEAEQYQGEKIRGMCLCRAITQAAMLAFIGIWNAANGLRELRRTGRINISDDSHASKMQLRPENQLISNMAFMITTALYYEPSKPWDWV